MESGYENDNLRRLEEAGMCRKSPLPKRYQEVIRDLPRESVDCLISVKEHFDRAGLSPEESESEFREYIHWF
jgi:hypothetical protein